MNLEQAAQFVKNPRELNLSHAASLRMLSDKHPYTSIYPLLYLTALANGKSPDLDEALAKYAYKISDRTRLYHLLKGPVAETSQEEEKAPAVSNISFEQFTQELVETETPAEPLETKEPLQEVLREPETFAEEPHIAETADEEKEIIADEPEIERKSEIEIALDFDAVTTAHSLEQYAEIGDKQTAEAASSTAEDETGDQIGDTAEILPSPALRSFGSWLKSGSSPAPAAPKPAEKPKAEELIEKFIQQEPSISRGRKEFFSPSRKAKESLNEDAVPVSETLARIYAAQGNYPKAIHVYHQLMLSIPEKKSFFAIQIEELKQKITL